MQVNEIMTEKVRAVGADASIRQAAEEMARIHIGALPVVRDGKLAGMLTDRDITVRVVSQGLNPGDTKVEQAMTTSAFTVQADQDVADAARVMREQQVRRAPVLDNEQRVVGIVSLGDLAVKTGDEELSGAVLKEVSEPASPDLA